MRCLPTALPARSYALKVGEEKMVDTYTKIVSLLLADGVFEEVHMVEVVRALVCILDGTCNGFIRPVVHEILSCGSNSNDV